MSTLQPRWRNIGVTGFTNPADLQYVWADFNRRRGYFVPADYPLQPRLMAGVLVSDETMRGQPNHVMEKLYPKREELGHIYPRTLAQFVSPAHLLRLFHYNTQTPENLQNEVAAIVEVSNNNFDGFQFNICWPDPSHLHTLKQRHPDKHIILQIGSTALREYQYVREGSSFGYSVDGFMSRIREYAGCIDEVLVDPSGGKGYAIQNEGLIPLVQELGKLPALGVNVAGGLSEETIELVQPFLDVCPHVGIDAQGKLVDEATGQLHREKCAAYNRAALNFFYPKPADRRVNDMRELDLLIGRYPGGSNDDAMSGGIPRG